MLTLPDKTEPTCWILFRKLALLAPDGAEPIAAALDLLEQVYRFLATSRIVNTRFSRTLLKQRRHATEFFSDPWVDGWNIVSTAQLLAYRALPRPLGTHASDWPFGFRMQLCACLLVALKWKKADSVMRTGCDVLVTAACCFMSAAEQDAVRGDKTKKASVFDAVMSAEARLVRDVFCLSLGEGAMSAVELQLGAAHTDGFLSPRETAVARNLAVFQLRAVVRKAPETLMNDCLPAALIFNSLRWMNMRPESVQHEVQALAAEVASMLMITKRDDLWVGPFADPVGHTGRHLACSVEDLLRA
jgi:hypothetical protein